MRVATVGLALALSLPSFPAAAQTEPRFGAYMIAGSASGADQAGAAAGGVLAYEVTRRLSVEVSGAYLDRGPGISAVPVSAALAFDLLGGNRRLTPFLVAGGGVMRSSFDLGHARFDSRSPQRSSVIQPGAQPGSGLVVWVDGTLPDFYSERLNQDLTGEAPLTGTVAYTDAALVGGGGLRFSLGPKGDVRADARAITAYRSGRHQTLGVYTVQLGLRF